MRYDRDAMLRLLKQARDCDATDVHLKVPARPSMRVEGELVAVAGQKLAPCDTKAAVQALMALAGVEFPLVRCQEHEFAFGLRGVGRFRVSLFRQRGSLGVVVHRMATEVPTLVGLGVPAEYGEIPKRPGLTLLCGTRRRELLNGIVDILNTTEGSHVVVLEDSLEYLHADRRAAISQREVGIDTASWCVGIRTAMRHDPDLIAVGDVPEPEVAACVLQAVESGHRVIACVPTRNPEDAIGWLVRLFGNERETEASARIADALEISMSLDDGFSCVEMTEQVRECVRVGAPMPVLRTTAY